MEEPEDEELDCPVCGFLVDKDHDECSTCGAELREDEDEDFEVPGME